MIHIRHAHDRGHTQLDWLKSHHTFSFGDYFDATQMGFHSLRVINEDFVQPNGGFPTHSHTNMEIITYVLSGALTHQDSLGNGSIIKPGEVQRMSAGNGVQHSEMNASATDPVHFLQIWIIPQQKNLLHSYEQKTFTEQQMHNQFCLLASADARDQSIKIHQAVDLYVAKLAAGATLHYQFQNQHHGWLQVARGAIELNNLRLAPGDGAAITQESKVVITAQENAEILLFDL